MWVNQTTRQLFAAGGSAQVHEPVGAVGHDEIENKEYFNRNAERNDDQDNSDKNEDDNVNVLPENILPDNLQNYGDVLDSIDNGQN